MPSRRQYFELFFYPLWLIGWAFGEVFGIQKLAADIFHMPGKVDLSFAFWLLFWTCMGIAFGAAWLWNAFGRETLRVDSEQIMLSRTVFGIGPRWRIVRATAQRLRRIDPSPPRWWDSFGGRRNDLFGLRDARIAFNGSSEFRSVPHTWRIGAGMNAREATRVVDTLRQYIDAKQR